MCNLVERQRKYLKELEKNGNVHKLSVRQRRLKRFYDQQNGKCYWCENDMVLWWAVDSKFYSKHFGTTATIEHLLPRADGGSSRVSNLAAACNDCNAIRSTIAHDAFKWVASVPARFARFKRLKEARSVKANSIKLSGREKRQSIMVFNLALLFMCHSIGSNKS